MHDAAKQAADVTLTPLQNEAFSSAVVRLRASQQALEDAQQTFEVARRMLGVPPGAMVDYDSDTGLVKWAIPETVPEPED